MSDAALPPPGRRAATAVAAVELPGLTGLMTLAVCVVVVVSLFLAREVLIPITLAVLLSFVLAPLVQLLRRAHLGRLWLGRAPAVILAVLIALGIIASLGAVIGIQMAQLADDIPRYTSTIETKLAAARGLASSRVFALLGGLGHSLEAPTAPAASAPTQASANDPPPPMPVEVHQPTPTPLQLAETILAPVIGPLATAAIVFIVAIFILLQQEDLRDRLIRLLGADDLHRATAALDDAARRLSKYFLTQLALNAAFGLIIGLGLWLIGVPNPVLWGILATLFRFVPYVGSIISAGIPLALAAAVDPGWSMLLWTLALFAITEPVMGQGIEPLVYGRSTGLSPISVVVSAIFWGWLWGPIGLILSMPLTLCLVVLGRHVKRLEFIDVVLGDRPALTPVESFYQRMLAGDPDEAQDYAEILLRDRSLSSYYDEVALKGLLLAAGDAERGVLTPEQIARIEAAMEELVDELAEHDDADPAPEHADDGPVAPPPQERDLPRNPAPETPEAPATPWQTSAKILCIAGRGPLDRACAIMLAQLLEKHGLQARIVDHDATARNRIATLDTAGIAILCLCHLEITGNPTHLRYLLRRLRTRIPEAPILVGIWPAEETPLHDDRLRTAIGADHFATSLRGAVTTCLEIARADATVH